MREINALLACTACTGSQWFVSTRARMDMLTCLQMRAEIHVSRIRQEAPHARHTLSYDLKRRVLDLNILIPSPHTFPHKNLAFSVLFHYIGNDQSEKARGSKVTISRSWYLYLSTRTNQLYLALAVPFRRINIDQSVARSTDRNNPNVCVRMTLCAHVRAHVCVYGIACANAQICVYRQIRFRTAIRTDSPAFKTASLISSVSSGTITHLSRSTILTEDAVDVCRATEDGNRGEAEWKTS